jgi:hypothetical protein
MNHCEYLNQEPEYEPESEKQIGQLDVFFCEMTGRPCVANWLEPLKEDKSNMAHGWFYKDYVAEDRCPAYNISKDLAKKINEFRNTRKADFIAKMDKILHPSLYT